MLLVITIPLGQSVALRESMDQRFQLSSVTARVEIGVRLIPPLNSLNVNRFGARLCKFICKYCFAHYLFIIKLAELISYIFIFLLEPNQ